MVFDGSKESCPNYENESLNTGYDEFIRAGEADDPAHGRLDYNKKCFNICATITGPTDNPITKNMYIDNEECSECPDPDDGTINQRYNSDNLPPLGSVRDLTNKGIYGMCSDSPWW